MIPLFKLFIVRENPRDVTGTGSGDGTKDVSFFLAFKLLFLAFKQSTANLLECPLDVSLDRVARHLSNGPTAIKADEITLYKKSLT